MSAPGVLTSLDVVGWHASRCFWHGSIRSAKAPNPPAVLRVDSSTGKVDVLPTTTTGHVTFDGKLTAEPCAGRRDGGSA